MAARVSPSSPVREVAASGEAAPLVEIKITTRDMVTRATRRSLEFSPEKVLKDIFYKPINGRITELRYVEELDCVGLYLLPEGKLFLPYDDDINSPINFHYVFKHLLIFLDDDNNPVSFGACDKNLSYYPVTSDISRLSLAKCKMYFFTPKSEPSLMHSTAKAAGLVKLSDESVITSFAASFPSGDLEDTRRKV
jgi:hypothetical protein